MRRIYAAVRDQNWNTIPGVATNHEVDARKDSFNVRFDVRHANDELEFSWRGAITGTADGRMSFSLDGEAGRDFPYNRIGFCVLHPWRETAGVHYRGETPSGPVEGTFPLLVGSQDFVDGLYISLFPAVSGLEIDVGHHTTAVFEFEGDLFECEDQRNWSDASFKTYCTPLVEGLPHRATVGRRVLRQCSSPPARAGRPRPARAGRRRSRARRGDGHPSPAAGPRSPGRRSAAVRTRGRAPACARAVASAACAAPGAGVLAG